MTNTQEPSNGYYRIKVRQGKGWELKPNALDNDGKIFYFKTGWKITAEWSSIYPGEYAMIPHDKNYPSDGLAWIASGDLVRVENSHKSNLIFPQHTCSPFLLKNVTCRAIEPCKECGKERFYCEPNIPEIKQEEVSEWVEDFDDMYKGRVKDLYFHSIRAFIKHLLQKTREEERERACKILFEEWDSLNNPKNYSDIKNKILNQ